MDNPGRFIIAAILIILGLSALFDFDIWKYFWPLLLIFIGLSMLSKGSRSMNGYVVSDEQQEDKIDYSVVFSGFNRKILTDNFLGGKVNAVFGGGELDLRGAKIPKGKIAGLEVNAVFGGVKIIVPDSWKVNSSVTGIVGAFENKTISPKGKSEGTLMLKGSAVFGGGEIVSG